MTTETGLDRLLKSKEEQDKITGNFGYLCHNASVTKELEIGVVKLKELFGNRLKSIFGPQHGFVCDVQDNMIESTHYIHPYFKLPVYSLYSETRIPTDDMLKEIDTIVVDLQDVGTRVYTYISTLSLLMEKCKTLGKKVVVLDRPNPVGGEIIEGNVLDPYYKSFVGHHPIPMRHALTMAEYARFAHTFHGANCELDYVLMEGWSRSMFYHDTGLAWVNPSPNLATMDSSLVFVGTVLFEGTNVSEGRGTTRSLEQLGHPLIEPYKLTEKLKQMIRKEELTGFEIRPTIFQPMFQKHQGSSCGGFFIHPTDLKEFRPWRLGQLFCKFFYDELGKDFAWKEPPYEYEYDKNPMDLINGTHLIREAIESGKDLSEVWELEIQTQSEFLEQRKGILLY